jgi:AcrR family transcriptional regulator
MAKPTDRPTAAAASDAVDEESRASRFMRSALAILGETGRTDFTVLEVVERSKTSLRSFYQHFTTKDELLLALIDKIMAESTLNWREATDGLDATAALRLLVERISAPASTSTQDSINRGLTFYNDHLAETLPREYARVLSPLHVLIADIIERGIDEGTFSPEVDVDDRGADHADGARRDAAARPRRRTQRCANRCRTHLHVLRPHPREVTLNRPLAALSSPSPPLGPEWCRRRPDVVTSLPLRNNDTLSSRICLHASFPIPSSTRTTTSTSPRKR